MHLWNPELIWTLLAALQIKAVPIPETGPSAIAQDP